MPRPRSASFREADVVRAVKAAQKAGLCVSEVECRRDGSVIIKSGQPKDLPKPDGEPSIRDIIAAKRARNGTPRHGH